MKCVLQNSYIEILTPSTSECDHLRRQVIYKSYSVKMRSLGWVLIQNARCPCTKGNLDTDLHTRKTPCEDVGENLGSASQGPTKIAREQPKAKAGAWNRFFLIVLERNANTLILNF